MIIHHEAGTVRLIFEFEPGESIAIPMGILIANFPRGTPNERMYNAGIQAILLIEDRRRKSLQGTRNE